MEATKIRVLTQRILEAQSAELAVCKSRVDDLRAAIKATNTDIEVAFKNFAHTQFVQNASTYGREVDDMVANAEIAMGENRALIVDLEKKIEALDQELASFNGILINARARVAEALAQDEVFAEKRKLLDERLLAAELGKEKYNDLLEEVEAKLPVYQASTVFQYLLNARFGTPGYKGTGIVARLDGALARKTAFSDNMDSYAILLGIKAEATTRLEQLDCDYRAALKSCEDYENLCYKIPEIIDCIENIESHEAERAAKQTDLQARLEQEKLYWIAGDGSSLAAKGLILKMLLQKDAQALSALASATPSSGDDEALDLIQSKLAAIRSLNDELNTAKITMQRSETAFGKVKEMCNAIDYDSRLSGSLYRYTSEAIVVELLTRFISSGMELSELLTVLRNLCTYRPQSSTTLTWTTTSSGSSRGSGSRSSGSGSFSTRSSTGGGSFKTTGSF